MRRSWILYTTAAFLFFSVPVRAETGTPAVSTGTTSGEALPPAPPVEKRFWRAAGELIVVGYSPWLFSHYIMDYDYADISMDSVRRNFREDPEFDRDSFQTNQWGHP